MAIGERIHFIRNLRGMTQKYLGILAGFPEKTADIRMAQYESGTRTPKADLTNKLAQILKVSPHALHLPNIDSKVVYTGNPSTQGTLQSAAEATHRRHTNIVLAQIQSIGKTV